MYGQKFGVLHLLFLFFCELFLFWLECSGLHGRRNQESARALENSMHTILNYGFFRTKSMNKDLSKNQVNGTLPIMLVFLARMGYTIEYVKQIHIAKGGKIETGKGMIDSTTTPGCEIWFSERLNEPLKVAYYFSV